MKRQLIRWAALLQIGLVLFTGCHPTQPFFMGEDGDLSHYLQSATQIEYPDLASQPLPEASNSLPPLTVENTEFTFLDLSLEECINYALVNAKVLLSVPGSSQFDGDIITTTLSSPSQQLRTIYDPALVSSTTNSQPAVIDQNGNRVLPRGASRANQVGGVEDALSEFDAQYSTFFSSNTSDRQRNNVSNGFQPSFFQGVDSTYQSAISKRIATGGVATLRAQTVYSQSNATVPTARVVPSDFTQIIEAQVQHPLMRNRGTLVNRIPVVLARLNEDQSLTQYEESVRNLVKKVEFAYWDLYCAYWALESSKIGLQSSLEVYRAAEARNVVGVGENAPAYRAKAQAYRFWAQAKAALGGTTAPGGDAGVLGREAELRFLMGWGATDGKLIRPSDRPTVARADFDWEAIRAETLGCNLDIRNQKTNVKRSELELISSKNQLLPDLNLSTLYRWTGMGDTWLTQNGGNEFPGNPAGTQPFTSAMESLLGGKYQEVGLRLEFTPNAFGMRRALADVTNKELALAREHATLEQKEIAAIAAISQQIRNLHGNYSQLKMKLNEWTSYENEAKLRMVKYEEGAPGTEQLLEELLRAQQFRAQAQQEYYRAVCEYNKSIVMVHLQKGSLLDYNNIALTEGPWAEKAYWDATERARERDAALFLDYGASRPSVVSRGPVAQKALGDQGNGVYLQEGEMLEEGIQDWELVQPMDLPKTEKMNLGNPEVIETPKPNVQDSGANEIRSRLRSATSEAHSGQSVRIASGEVSNGNEVQAAQWQSSERQGSPRQSASSSTGTRGSAGVVGTGVNSLRSAEGWQPSGNNGQPTNGLRR